ncbi:hypothetical protein [uncultured Erythrobacter sp.]|uniref:hypothetical protein n=1 Tax=uncultured Erythrobacter sp. TaxID=263913 RepID=UPI002659B9C1|nr:hypothetical protein [uncultured Erythrobacter sp.]
MTTARSAQRERSTPQRQRSGLSVATVLFGLPLAFSTPVLADDTVSIIATADVAPVCFFDGQVFPTAGITTAGEPIAGGENATSLVNLADSRDQAIGTYRYRCNTLAAAVTITTLNDFKLVNPTGGPTAQIPYLLKIPGLPQLAGGFTVTTAYLDDTGPDVPVTERVLLVDVGTLNLFNLAPGFYTDQVVVTIQATQ